jgi:chemotaxis response regulator CheB
MHESTLLVGGTFNGMKGVGAKGSLVMKEAGVNTLVHDETNRVVFGTRKDVLKIGIPEKVIPNPRKHPCTGAIDIESTLHLAVLFPLC